MPPKTPEEPARPCIIVAIDDSNNLNFQVQGFDAIMLWGISRQLQKFGDQLYFQQQMAANDKEPRLIRPN